MKTKKNPYTLPEDVIGHAFYSNFWHSSLFDFDALTEYFDDEDFGFDEIIEIYRLIRVARGYGVGTQYVKIFLEWILEYHLEEYKKWVVNHKHELDYFLNEL